MSKDVLERFSHTREYAPVIFVAGTISVPRRSNRRCDDLRSYDKFRSTTFCVAGTFRPRKSIREYQA